MPRSALTKHLGAGKGRELLQAAEEVAVGVGQVPMQLAEVAVPLPDHYLPGTQALTPAGNGDGGNRLPPPQPGPAHACMRACVRAHVRACVAWGTAAAPPRAEELPVVPLLLLHLELGNGPLPPRSLTSLTSSGSLFEMN